MDPSIAIDSEDNPQWIHLPESINKLKSIPYRRCQLQQIITLLKEHTIEFQDALYSDVGMSQCMNANETSMSISMVKTADADLKKRLPRKQSVLNLRKRRAVDAAQHEADHGEGGRIVLIVGSTEYPILSIFPPMAAAIASGNLVVVQTSSLIPSTNALMRDLITCHLDSSIIRVVSGEPSEAFAPLQLRTEEIKTVTLCDTHDTTTYSTSHQDITQGSDRRRGFSSFLAAVCISEHQFHPESSNPFLIPFP
ncbi:aldehyde dehydrogenase family protein [Moniliophthora roreri]|uniref:Aldehyde dehydrogenase domain-containing protein n=1 Tax=Moniliophthora roreri TaxID=221103 RepID=A0A0W0F2F3_MONRR|nr:aldehyde dehydrogenase family protein [Moniliophthora roreri]